MAHVVGQLEAAHVCDVLTKRVLPIYLPEGKRQELHGALCRPGYPGPLPLTPTTLSIPRDFLEKPSPPTTHVYSVILCELTNACVSAHKYAHSQSRMKGHERQGWRGVSPAGCRQ
jgi:hypothetical protein